MKIILPVSLALAQLFVMSAFAQSKGEADPAQSKAAMSAPASPADKAAAKSERKAAGKAVAKSDAAKAEDPMNKSMGTAKVASKDERKAAAKARKASAQSSMKKGEISSGEK